MKMDRALAGQLPILRRAGSARGRGIFTMRFLLLPSAERRSMCALYAFLRHTDDLADEPAPRDRQSPCTRRLAARARSAPWPVAGHAWPGFPALADTVARHAIPRRLAR